jgi:hypothetical protein
MLDTAPVNDQHNFARLIIYINDDINDQRAERLLFRAYVTPIVTPGAFQAADKLSARLAKASGSVSCFWQGCAPLRSGHGLALLPNSSRAEQR